MRGFTHFLTLSLGVLIGLYYSSLQTEAIQEEIKAHLETSVQCSDIDLPQLCKEYSDHAVKSEEVLEPSQSKTKYSLEVEAAQRKRTLSKLQEKFQLAQTQDDIPGALEALEGMKKLASKSQQYFESQSDFSMRQEDWGAAKSTLQECLSQYPKSKRCNIHFSSLALQDGSKEEQEAAVKSCLTHYPNEPQCRNIRAMLYMSQGEFAQATQLYRELLKSNGDYGVRFDHGMLEWQLALSLEGSNNHDEALKHFDRACQLNFAPACQKVEQLHSQI